jgi:hypothetical protein
MEPPLICPSCKADIETRYACTNCGFVFARQRCLLPSCKALNPPDAKFCGDCGSPLSISPRRWANFLHLHQRIITHPYRDRTIFFGLIGALVLPLGDLLCSSHDQRQQHPSRRMELDSGVHSLRHTADSRGLRGLSDLSQRQPHSCVPFGIRFRISGGHRGRGHRISNDPIHRSALTGSLVTYYL